MRPLRPRRSVLYMPGSNPRALEKARSLPADGLILDLEDSVAPDAKEEARGHVVEALKAGGFGPREVIVRVNGLDTPWGEADLKAMAPLGPDTILVPKIDGPADVARANQNLATAGAPDATRLWVMMETPRAILNALAIADAARAAGSRLEAFVMGTNDLIKELHCASVPGRAPLLPSLAMTLLAARAVGLTALDGVFNAIQDTDGLIEVCRQGAALGFDGKTLIHPSQVEHANRAFTPAEDDVIWARKITGEFQKPENKGKGVIKVEGRMVELLHAEDARRLVAIADAIAARSSA